MIHYVPGLPELLPLVTQERGGKRHYVAPSGHLLPSVTTVLSHFNQKSLVDWRARVGQAEANRISNVASTRGTRFHSLMERYLRNEDNILRDVMPDMKQAFFDIRPTLQKINNIHYIEAQLYSMSLGVAGRTDVIAEYDGVLSIIDFKTSRREKKEQHIHGYYEQATAYSLMYEELTGTAVDQIVILMSSDGLDKPQIFVQEKGNYIASLKAKIKTFQKEFGYVS